MNDLAPRWQNVPGLPGVRFGSNSESKFDIQRDPTDGISGMPPNNGEFMLPHVTTFQGMFSSIAKVYRNSDEAIKDSFENARFMRNDVTVMECVEMRQRAVALLDWSIKPEDTKNKEHVAFCAEVEKIVRKIPRFMQYQENLLHATWYGKYANEQRWGKRLINNSMRSVPVQWLPINGDKIVFRFDDGIGDHRPDQIGIRVAMTNRGLTELKGRKIEPTDRGMAYFLDTWERPLLALHKYRIEDGEFEEPSNAGRVHGVGVRSVIYWTWYQKQETLAYLMEYLERSAAGIEIWYYPMGNPQAEEKVRTAAEERISNGRNVVMVPRPQGEDAAYYNVERIEPSMAGATELKSIITEYFGHSIKRYILGQTLTTEASSTGLGSNLADIHMDTFMQIVRYDGMLLEETLDTDLLAAIVAFNFPKMVHVPIHFNKSFSEPDSESLLKALQMAYDMGLRINAETVRDLVGAAKPADDDEILSKMDQMKAEQDAAMAQAGAMGLNGQPGQQPGQQMEAPPEPTATPTAQPTEQAEYMASSTPSENSERSRVQVFGAGWKESDHNRDAGGQFTPDLTGWDKPINQPASLKGQKPLFDEIDPGAIGNKPSAPQKPKHDPRQKALFSAGNQSVAARIRAANKRRKLQVA